MRVSDSKSYLPRKHTEEKILMASESTEGHGKIRATGLQINQYEMQPNYYWILPSFVRSLKAYGTHCTMHDAWRFMIGIRKIKRSSRQNGHIIRGCRIPHYARYWGGCFWVSKSIKIFGSECVGSYRRWVCISGSLCWNGDGSLLKDYYPQS